MLPSFFSDSQFWLVFLTAALVLNASPGPDILYVVSQSLRGGKRHGIVSSAGVCSGALFHVFIGAMGLSALVLSLPFALESLKFIGVAYLMYLAWQTFTRPAAVFTDNTPTVTDADGLWQVYRQGVWIDILNPKVALFFLAFLPQFIRPEIGQLTAQFVLLGLTIIAMAFVIESLYAVMAAQLTEKIRQHGHWQARLNHVTGMVLMALAIHLAISHFR